MSERTPGGGAQEIDTWQAQFSRPSTLQAPSFFYRLYTTSLRLSARDGLRRSDPLHPIDVSDGNNQSRAPNSNERFGAYVLLHRRVLRQQKVFQPKV